MERNFKKEIQEAASNPIDMAEMMAQLVQVRRREKHESFPPHGRFRICPFNGSFERKFLCAGGAGLTRVVPPSKLRLDSHYPSLNNAVKTTLHRVRGGAIGILPGL